MKSGIRIGLAATALIAGAALANAQSAQTNEPSAGEHQSPKAPISGSKTHSDDNYQQGRSSAKENSPQSKEGIGSDSRSGASQQEQTTRQRQKTMKDRDSMSQSNPQGGSQGRSTTMEGGRRSDEGTGASRTDSREQQLGRENQREMKDRRGGSHMSRQGAQGTEGRSSTGLSQEQNVRIREDIIKNRAARVDNVDFALNVGAVVPRHIHLVPLPARVVRIMPRYRGFKYIVVRDEIIVIDPRTYRIVAVIGA